MKSTLLQKIRCEPLRFAALRYQHSIVKPEGRNYEYVIDSSLPEKKAITAIENEYKIKNNLKFLELGRVNIDVTNNKMKAQWRLKDNLEEEAEIPAVMDEIKKVIKFEQTKGNLTCYSCNVPLQNENRERRGYFKLPEKKSREAKSDFHKDSEMALMDEFRSMAEKMPTDSKVIEFNDLQKMKSFQELREFVDLKFECERCKVIKSNNLSKLNNVEDSVSDLKGIQNNATIVYICSILNFPLGIEPEIVKENRNIIYLINKSDLFFSKEIESQRLGTSYFKDILREYLNIRDPRVWLVSAEKGWNIVPFINSLPKHQDVYFVGRENAGKSSLINSVIKKTKLSGKVPAPGIFGLPGFTRESKRFQCGLGISIIDTPGFRTSQGSITDLLLNTQKSKSKYSKVCPMDVKKLFKPINTNSTKIFDGKSVLSYGGLFYLLPPKNAIIKMRYSFNKVGPKLENKYSSMQRASELNDIRPVELGERFLVNKETFETMQLYEIPSFKGNVDVVIQDIGFFTINPTSSPSDVKGNFRIWLPAGVKAIVRDSMFKYIYKSKEGKLRRVFDEGTGLQWGQLKPISM